MGYAMRPVEEIWHEGTDLFLNRDDILPFLRDLADRAGASLCEREYGDMTTVWFEKASKVLDYIESNRKFTAKSFAKSLRKSWGVEPESNSLENLMSNMRNLVRQWRKAIDKGADQIIFYID